jgi:hypothetical protein
MGILIFYALWLEQRRLAANQPPPNIKIFPEIDKKP